MAEQGIRSSIGVRIEGPEQSLGDLPRDLEPAERLLGVGRSTSWSSIANVLADAIERQQAEDAMEHRALHDPLTGLPNRVLFTDRLEQAFERVRRHPRSLAAILFIDVDHFKQVNDTLGHQAGDELLVGVATRLREAVRPTDTVARFGGDEFGLLLEEVGSERDAIATAERIAAGFARPFVLDSGSQFVTASIGIALADGHEEPQALLRDADAAMYRAKERGRARYELFDEDLRARALARVRMENDLRRAIDLNELRLVYQPVVTLRDEQMAAVEALLRWEHPQRGAMLAERVHPGRRGERADRPDRPVGDRDRAARRGPLGAGCGPTGRRCDSGSTSPTTSSRTCASRSSSRRRSTASAVDPEQRLPRARRERAAGRGRADPPLAAGSEADRCAPGDR